ncbi:hypothetical protein J2O09_04095 [Elizabethkingia anophelis]|uniref:hypothetical protein n=1 Tax=Elizabethkingia anophelis TaxID=1117645 RepID=UPI0020B80041|nr:hypothetical protein [Elizabethkingia anophelis]UTG62151.1 hypothetical protein J2O09_04095 [Elizabethkingia anophelis]UXM68420.1 hypothetical protein N7E57_04100 [Elizabethkingia anophelis]
MKRALSIFFLIIFLSTTSIGNQLLKLPDLIEHFTSHQEEHDEEADSFIGFLMEHYSYDSPHNNLANQSHKNLPFKSLDVHAPHIAVFNFQVSTFTFLKNIPDIKEKPLSSTNSFVTSAQLEGIWQPPRFC